IYEKPELRSFYQLRFDTEAEAQGAKAVLDEGKPIEEFAAEKGISLDTVTFTDTTRADILDPTVAEAAFNAALESDSVSDPVQGIFGWTVIVMTAITPPETQEFDDVKEEIRAQYLEQDVQRRIYDAIEAIEDARDTGADLVAAAEETGARVTAFGPVDAFSFEPGGAIVDEIPGAVLREAFTVGEGEESEVVEYDDDSGSFYVVVDEVIPSALSPFDDVAAEVEPRWREAERDRRIGDVVRSLKEKVSGGASFESAAQSIGAEITEITLTRGETNETFTTRLNEDLFIASTDEIVDGDAAESDVAVVAQLTGIDFDRTELNPALERSFKRNFGFQYDQEIIDAYLSDIRDEYGVRIDRAKIDQLFSEGG
ncbi:MAG: peptidyl-prolyl cis-trans isomerase, partial [Pseudomonadota bacterium]